MLGIADRGWERGGVRSAFALYETTGTKRRASVRARVYITPKAEVLDPAGKAVERSLHTLGFDEVRSVRLGKYIELEVGGDRDRASDRLEEMCRRLLANGVIEDYRFEVED